MSNYQPGRADSDDGKVPAFIVYALYIAGVFSANLISPIGVIVSYVCRDTASAWVRTHLDQQIRMFWVVFWWMIAPGLIGLALLVSMNLFAWALLIPLALVYFVIAVVTTVWFCVKSVMGLLKLVNSQPA